MQRDNGGNNLAARSASLEVLQSVFLRQRPLNEALERLLVSARLDPRDTAFARAIVMAVLRHLGQIDAVLASFLQNPLPVRAGPAELILRQACAEMVFLDVPPHAAVSCAVDLAARDPRARHFKSLVNAVARRIAGGGRAIAAGGDAARLNTPGWAWDLLEAQYGDAVAHAIGTAHGSEPPVDFSVKGDIAAAARQLDAEILPTGSLRRKGVGRIEELPGYAEGAWWIQDAAAALPARLLGDIAGRTVLDLCAAPGGKTAQLAAAGAHVTAVDADPKRMERLTANMKRLGLPFTAVTADLRKWQPASPANAVLLDAPCSATGTIRRHPDICWRKDISDVFAQSALQLPLLQAAARMVEPGGLLVYCVCSLFREEGEEVIEPFLQATGGAFARVPIEPAEIGGEAAFITPAGDLRTHPGQWPGRGGLDGFFACRLRRIR